MTVHSPVSPLLHPSRVSARVASPALGWGLAALAFGFAAPLGAAAQPLQAPPPIEASEAAPPVAQAPQRVVASSSQSASHTADEGAILDAINMLRAAESLGPLVGHAGLMEAARRHSEEMAQSRTLAHVSPTTGSPADRASAAGVRALRVTQNISRRPSAGAAHEAILASEAHRAQLLDPHATHIGVGLARGEDGFYLTELMARLVPEPALPPPSIADVPQPRVAPVPVAPEPQPEPEPAPAEDYAQETYEQAPEPAPQVTSVPMAQTQAVAPAPPTPSGSLPTLRLTRAHRGVAGYWLFHEGRWWYFPVPPGTRTGQLLYPDTSVQGTPPGFQGSTPMASQSPVRVHPTPPSTAPRGYWRLTPQ